MNFALPFCGCAEPPEIGSLSLEFDSCTRETLLDAALPLAFLIVSLGVNSLRRYRTWRTGALRLTGDADTLRLPTTKQAALLRQSLILLVLVLLEISTWAFIFAWRLESAILDRDNPKHATELTSALTERCGTPPYQVLDPILALIPRIYILILVIRSFTTPADPVAPSKFTLYNPHFLTFYSFALISAIVRIFAHFGTLLNSRDGVPSGVEKGFSLVDCFICLAIWLVSATTPSELDQGELLDFDDDDDGVMVLNDGRVVRNGRILSFEATASPLSFMTFGWINSLLHKAYKKPLTADQLWALPLRQRAQENFRQFKQTINSSLVRRIYEANKTIILVQFVTAIAAVFFHYANPFFLRKLLNYIQDSKNQPSDIGYLYCLAIFVCSIISTLVASQTLLWGRRWHVSMTNMLNSEIYEHTLQLNHPKETTVNKSESEEDAENALPNKLASLMSRDTERLAELASYLHIFYTCPLEIGVGVIFLYQVLGNSFLAGLVVMAVTLPSTHFISQRLIHVQKQLEEAKTWRTRLLKELFEGIKTTKFLAWEHKWEHVIAAARDDELVKLIKLYTQNTILGLIWFATPVLVTTISFAWYTLIEKNTLDASTAFVSIVLFGMLREPLNVMPQAFMAYNDAKVSLEHINSFLNSGEKRYSDSDSSTPYEAMNYSYTEHVQTGFDEGSFQWLPKSEPSVRRPYVRDKATLSPNSSDGHLSSFRLTVPEIDFPVGSISVITGPRKSGKSSMISALLGEMKGVSGSSHIPSRFLTMRTNLIRDQKYRALYVFRVAYVAQIPWIESGTIRENILFSDPWDDSRYRAVLYQCDLLRDLSLLENGDLTQIGERGMALTESQKHKISLARAVYSRAKTVLIDDLFALLETPTVNFLFDKCISGDLMQGRTVIITATELGQWACNAQLLVCLDSGNVSQIERECDAISTWVFTHQARRDSSTAVVASDDRIEALFETDNVYTDDDFFDEASVLRESIAAPEDITIENTKARKYAYATYFSACGGWQFWMSAIMFTVLARVSSISESYWLKMWSVAYTSPQPIFIPTPTQPEKEIPDENVINHYVIIYLGLSMVTVAFNFSRTVVQYRGSLQASNRIFLRLLQAVCHAPLQFFDNTLQSDIMNRFSKDMETVDSSIGWHVNFLLQTLFGIIGVVIAIGFILPEVYIVSFFAALLYLYIGMIYIRASGELKKLNTDTRPAIVCLYADTLAGLSTIRAYREQRGMMRKMFQRLDENMRPFYTLWTTNRWLFVRVEVLGALISLFISVLLIYKRDTVDAGSAGIALTFATSLLEYVYWLMRQSTTVDMHFEAVERINEYLDMPQEPPGVVEGSRPPAAWPATAAINVRDLMVSYGGEEDPILRHVSFNILSGEKVALVGRAGAEKNVLVSCIFRFVDPLRGSIKIDGVNIAWIGVKDLRSRITFIAKDGWLLSGTVRSNLDPFGEYDDYELWQALYRVHLAVSPISEEDVQNYVHSATTSTIYDLDMDLGKDGMALSVGNRQLLCVARALLRDCTRLVVLEEAQLTLETQEKMQRVIEEEFEDSTLLVIPYSLQSVLRYDRAMVFDQGDLVEYDNPADLLKREDGLLHSLFERAGILEAHITE